MKALKFMSGVVSVWGFLSIVALGLDYIGLLPVYDIHYKKKTDITPELSVFPGGNIQLNARFWEHVGNDQIESVTWTLKDSKGRDFPEIPSLRSVSVQLLPDFAGTMTVGVEAKLIGDDRKRTGRSSFHIVQTKPKQLDLVSEAQFLVPSTLKKNAIGHVQLYAGDDLWVDASVIDTTANTLSLTKRTRPLATWDGQAYLRYLPVSWDELKQSWDSPSVEYLLATKIEADSDKQSVDP